MGLAGFLTRVSQGQDQGVGQLGLSFGGSGEEFASRLIQVVDRIQFLAVVGLMSLFPC